MPKREMNLQNKVLKEEEFQLWAHLANSVLQHD